MPDHNKFHIATQRKHERRGCDIVGIEKGLLKIVRSLTDDIQECCFQIIQPVTEPRFGRELCEQFTTISQLGN